MCARLPGAIDGSASLGVAIRGSGRAGSDLEEAGDEIDSAPDAKASCTAFADLSADDDHDDAHPASAHGNRSLFRHSIADLVVGCSSVESGAYAIFGSFIGSPAGEIVLLGYVWALLHHLLGGLRHFVWAMGKGFHLPTANFMARATLIGSLSLTAAIWVAGHLIGGAT